MDGFLDSECQRFDITMFTRVKAFDLEPGEVKEGQFIMDPNDPTVGAVGWGVVADQQGRPMGIALLHRTEDGESVEQEVMVTTTACRFGGHRHWFACPGDGCARRTRVLYLSPGAPLFVCRLCAGIVYASTRETANQRLARREAKLLARLGGADPLGGQRPRGMHRKTFEKLSTLRAALSTGGR